MRESEAASKAFPANSGFLAVAAGAFGAHGLENMLETAPDGARRLEVFRTGAHYHLVHAVALLALATLHRHGRALIVARWSFVLGVLVFSGSLYLVGLTGIRWLGAITPVGGVGLLIGWAAVLMLRTDEVAQARN